MVKSNQKITKRKTNTWYKVIRTLEAPIYLSRDDATKNIPNFQMLFLNELSKRSDIARLRYVDLRWDEEIAVGEPLATQPPRAQEQSR